MPRPTRCSSSQTSPRTKTSSSSTSAPPTCRSGKRTAAPISCMWRPTVSCWPMRWLNTSWSRSGPIGSWCAVRRLAISLMPMPSSAPPAALAPPSSMTANTRTPLVAGATTSAPSRPASRRALMPHSPRFPTIRSSSSPTRISYSDPICPIAAEPTRAPSPARPG